VIPGNTIAILIAYALFGPQGMAEITHGGAFDLGFAIMPVVLQQLPCVVLGATWFFW
jgi:hypothetical protein